MQFLDYLRLKDTLHRLESATVLCMTATLSSAGIQRVCKDFNIAVEDVVCLPFDRPNLAILRTIVNRPSEKDAALLSSLRTRPRGPTIVYTSYKKDAKRLTELLVSKVR